MEKFVTSRRADEDRPAFSTGEADLARESRSGGRRPRLQARWELADGTQDGGRLICRWTVVPQVVPDAPGTVAVRPTRDVGHRGPGTEAVA